MQFHGGYYADDGGWQQELLPEDEANAISLPEMAMV
jgi:hypothetical protein